MERIYEYRMARRVLMADVSGGPWCICNCMSFTRPFCLALFLRTALACSGGYHLKRGGMPLHDAVGVNCKKGTLKIMAQVSSIYVMGICLIIVSDLT